MIGSFARFKIAMLNVIVSDPYGLLQLSLTRLVSKQLRNPSTYADRPT